MTNSKCVFMSQAKLAETGEGLEIAGALVEGSGAMEMAEGTQKLEVAKAAGAVDVAEVAAGASDPPRAETIVGYQFHNQEAAGPASPAAGNSH
jgi:hypothetical protein